MIFRKKMLFDKIKKLSFSNNVNSKIEFKTNREKNCSEQSKLKIILFNDITIYKNNKTIQKLTIITKKTSQI